jgi:hypothetical protein
MLNSTKIVAELYQSRHYSVDLLAELVALKNQGEDVCSCERKYIVLIAWIDILERYLLANYEDGQPVDPAPTECLTADQVNELVAKMKILRDGNRYAVDSDWVFVEGYWSDLGFWRDANNTWNDQVPIV